MVRTFALSLFAAILAVATLTIVLMNSSETSGADTVRKVNLDFQWRQEIENQPNGPIGRADTCSISGSNQADNVDILIYDAPVSHGLSGLTADFTYDGTKVRVISVDVQTQMLGQAAGSGPFNVTHDPLPDIDGTFSLAATDTGTGHESGSGVLARIRFQAIGSAGSSPIVATSLHVFAGDGGELPIDENKALDGGTFIFGNMFDDCQQTAPEMCNNGVDEDGDSQVDEPEPWPLAVDDADCDGFSATDEAAIGTDPAARCDIGAVSGNQWPPDIVSSRTITISDVLTLKHVFNSSVPPASSRFDLIPNGMITIGDVLRMKPFFGKSCLN